MNNHVAGWPDPPEELTVHAGIVDLWSIDLSREVRAEEIGAILDAGELTRYHQFRFPEHRRRFAAAHVMLRRILALYVRESPAGLSFAISPFGKPSLPSCLTTTEISFNLTHAGDLAVVGITPGETIGVDIEENVPLPDVDALMMHVCSPAEHAMLLALPADRRQAEFLRCWTRKEAYVKAKGLGVSLPLHTVTVLTEDGQGGEMRPEGFGEMWSIIDIAASPDYNGAVAVPTAPPDLRCWHSAVLPGSVLMQTSPEDMVRRNRNAPHTIFTGVHDERSGKVFAR